MCLRMLLAGYKLIKDLIIKEFREERNDMMSCITQDDGGVPDIERIY